MRASRFLSLSQYVRGSVQIAEVLCTIFSKVCRSWERGAYYIRHGIRMLLLQLTVIIAEIVHILVKHILVLEDHALVALCRSGPLVDDAAACFNSFWDTSRRRRQGSFVVVDR